MKNNALKTMCKDRGLGINGNKQALVQRLLTYPKGLPTKPNGRPKKDNAALPRAVTGEKEEENTGFHPDAKWRELVHSSVPVEEPRRPNRLVGPTAYKENEQEAQKYNFTETFDRPPFTVMAEEYTERKGKTPKRQCAPRLEKKVIEHGRADLGWLKKINSPSTAIHLIGSWRCFLRNESPSSPTILFRSLIGKLSPIRRPCWLMLDLVA